MIPDIQVKYIRIYVVYITENNKFTITIINECNVPNLSCKVNVFANDNVKIWNKRDCKMYYITACPTKKKETQQPCNVRKSKNAKILL